MVNASGHGVLEDARELIPLESSCFLVPVRLGDFSPTFDQNGPERRRRDLKEPLGTEIAAAAAMGGTALLITANPRATTLRLGGGPEWCRPECANAAPVSSASFLAVEDEPSVSIRDCS
jgi:hypothetical protein